ncbi:MAG: hypothetical protein J6R26_00980 [Paludibacteraceae bacterium]|nr:hypothetical protein [Paludibacteraceae bacterium]
MYGENKFLKIFSLVAFIAFAAVSCWSTTESLFLTLENAQIPKWVFWIAVVGLYVLTSICFKLMLGTFNQNIYMEKRTLKFIISVLGVVLLWILFSMPTNSHTFFYKQMAKATAVEELQHIDGELSNLTDTTVYIKKYNDEWNKYEGEVKLALDQLKQEIDNPQRFGFGPEAEAKLAKIEDLFDVKTGTITRRGTRNTTKQERNLVCKYYDNVVKEQLDVKLAQHQTKVQAFKKDFQTKINEVKPIRRDIQVVLNNLDNPTYDREEVLAQARQVAEKSYAVLKSSFGQLYEEDANVYTSDRLVKVTKVWGDYLSGRFKNTNYTLWYWILLSVIVDIAAFVFFDIAFKKEDM